MAHYCSDCSKLNLKEEKYPGCYECKKKKKDKEKNPYVWACNDACDKFDFDNSRNSAKRKDLHSTACREIHKDRSKITGFQLFWMLVIFLILFLVAIIQGY